MKHRDSLSRNLYAVTSALETALASERFSRSDGLLQRLDPRVKLVTFTGFIVAAGFQSGLNMLLLMLVPVPILGYLSGIHQQFLVKRVALFIPVFTAVVALPALFITKGTPLLSALGHTVITVQGAVTAALLVLRVTVSLSFGVLLILTTQWSKLLATFRWFHVPSLFVSVMAMTYRYIFVLLHTVNSMFLAGKSRNPGVLSARQQRRWLGQALATTLAKSAHLSEQVYSAMLSRGYRDHSLTMSGFKLTVSDVVWALLAVSATVFVIWRGLP